MFSKNWYIFSGIFILVIALKSFLIPDPFKLELSLYSENQLITRTYFEVKSDIWRSSIRFASTTEHMDPSINKLNWKVESKISLFQANTILKMAKSLGRKSKEQGYKFHCIHGDRLVGRLIYANALVEKIKIANCGGPGQDLIDRLMEVVEKEKSVTKTMVPVSD